MLHVTLNFSVKLNSGFLTKLRLCPLTFENIPGGTVYAPLSLSCSILSLSCIERAKGKTLAMLGLGKSCNGVISIGVPSNSRGRQRFQNSPQKVIIQSYIQTIILRKPKHTLLFFQNTYTFSLVFNAVVAFVSDY